MNLKPLLFCLPFLLNSCQEPVPQSTTYTPVLEKVSLNQDFIRKDSLKQARRAEDILDSLWSEKTLNNAFAKIRTFRSSEIAQFECDSFNFKKGNLIHKNITHLIIHLKNRNRYFGESMVYELKGDFWKFLMKIGTDLTTQGIVFKDVNGDGYQDFVLEGYGASGSGEKYFNEVYLYNSKAHTLDYIEGLGRNPNFNAKTGIVTCYYKPPGAWNAEKYRLNWNHLILLEAVEVEIQDIVEGPEQLKCIRKIYRYRKGERYLFRLDNVCAFPPEYKDYQELVKSYK